MSEHPYLKLNPYNTHLPILERIFLLKKIKRVFEFGLGIYSTPFFTEKAESVVSIEMQSEDWFNQMNYYDDNLKVLYRPGGELAIEYLRSDPTVYDLIFVDGHGGTRWKCVNTSFEKGYEIIVAHDTEQKTYEWDRIKMPDGYYKIDMVQYTPWTTVWSTDEKLITTLGIIDY